MIRWQYGHGLSGQGVAIILREGKGVGCCDLQSLLLQPQHLHLPIQVRPVQAEQLGGFAHVLAGALDGPVDVFLLKFIGGLGQVHARKAIGILGGGGKDKRQVRAIHLVMRTQIGDTLDQIAQLTNIAGPVMLFQPFASLRAKLEGLAAGGAAKLLQEMLRQHQDIFAPFPQGRQINRDHGEPIVQVLAELA